MKRDVNPVGDLLWFLNESDGALGISSCGFNPISGGGTVRLTHDHVLRAGLKPNPFLDEFLTYAGGKRVSSGDIARWRICADAWSRLSRTHQQVLSEEFGTPMTGRRALPTLRTHAEAAADKERSRKAMKSWRNAHAAATRGDPRTALFRDVARAA